MSVVDRPAARRPVAPTAAVALAYGVVLRQLLGRGRIIGLSALALIAPVSGWALGSADASLDDAVNLVAGIGLGLVLPVVALVFVNGQYGTIRMHQQKQFPDRRVATLLHNPSFEAIGAAFGIDAFRVTTNAEFDRVLDDLVGDPRPAVVEIIEGEERLTAWGNLKKS